MELKILLWVHIVGICSGLRGVRIQIPTAVKKGDSATLKCWYDLEGDPLYAVKWYKGGREFYRYAPNENPPVKTFPIGNLTVKKTESNATQVVLTKLELEAAGAYSCEVSADAPSFHTAIVNAAMNVVELPSEMPSIQGLKRKYRVEDPLRLNCTSGRSKPAANLTWYINDRQPLKSHVRTYGPLDTNESEWQISQIGLQFLVTHDHFVSGKLKIRCSASIYDIYWQSTEVSAEEDRPRVIHYEPAATIVGINYLQPPPNFQTGQKKPDGQVGVKVLGSSTAYSASLEERALEHFAYVDVFVREKEEKEEEEEEMKEKEDKEEEEGSRGALCEDDVSSMGSPRITTQQRYTTVGENRELLGSRHSDGDLKGLARMAEEWK